jgi:hypothetical protein
MSATLHIIAVAVLAALSLVDAWYCECGNYCPDPVKKFRAPVVCPAGSYCPKSKYNATSFPKPCPAGFFCGKGACTPTPCPCGYKCPAQSAAKIQCQPPFYCPQSKSTAQTVCPLGYKCDQPGMCTPTMCLPGTYVSCVGKKSCDPCAKGRYCPTATSTILCPAGYFCGGGVSAPVLCPAGKYCPLGSSIPTNCTRGASSKEGSSSKSQCT